MGTLPAPPLRLAIDKPDIAYSGGIRGIVELVVLKAIERELGGLEIRSVFDLIVGTR